MLKREREREYPIIPNAVSEIGSVEFGSSKVLERVRSVFPLFGDIDLIDESWYLRSGIVSHVSFDIFIYTL